MPVTITARGVAIFCGALLGGFGVLGLAISANSPGEGMYLLASWLMPITLFPAAALAATLDSDNPRGVADQASVLWPTYAGLVLYGGVAGARWLDVARRATPENYTALFLIAVMVIHAAVFLIGGAAFALFPKTRPAGFQMWLAYPLLLGCWLLGGFAMGTSL
jgi:hypothetical protein